MCTQYQSYIVIKVSGEFNEIILLSHSIRTHMLHINHEVKYWAVKLKAKYFIIYCQTLWTTS